MYARTDGSGGSTGGHGPLEPQKIEAERPKREKMRKRRKGKKWGKKRNANLLSFSLLVDMGGFIGEGASNAPSCMTKGYFLIHYRFFYIIPVFRAGAHGARACLLCVLSHPRSAENSTTAVQQPA
jgi:hypothetical protein